MDEIYKYAMEFNIPIMQDDGIEFLCNYIKKNNYKTILEIGTAIGYSAIKMALVDPEIHITSIERDYERYKLAIQNINKMKLSDRINVILADALEICINDKYDLIFIDAAKSQSIKFFEKYSPLLKNNGTIVTDNLNFHGLRVKKNELKNRNTKQMMNKIDNYINYLKQNEKYSTEFLSVGDGISLTKLV